MKLQTCFAIFITATLPIFAQLAPAKENEKEVKAQKVYADTHLTKARVLFDQGNLQECSLQIYKAVDLLHLHIITSDSIPTDKVINVSNDLAKLAEQIENGEIKKGSTLDHHFGDASKVLAVYYRQIAETALANKNPKKAAQAMERCAFHIENTAKWSGQKLGDAGRATVKGLRTTGASLLKSGDTAIKVPGDLFEKCSELLTKLGQNIKAPNKKKSQPKPNR